METLQIRSLVFLMALVSYGLATPNFCEQEKVTVLKQLVEIQREKGDAIKEMVQTQQAFGVDKLQTLEEKLYKVEGRLDFGEAQKVDKLQTLEEKLYKVEGRLDFGEAQRVDKLQTLEEKLNKVEGRLDVCEAQKVDKLQALEESQTELSLALNKLVVSLNQALDVSPMLNKLEGRLDVIEAKMDTQVDEMKNKQEAAQRSHEEVLQRVQDKLEFAQVNHEESLQRVEDKLGLAQVNYEEGLQRLEDKLEAAQLSHKEVLQHLEVLEHQVEAVSTEMSTVGCLPPFEPFGDDCLHLHTEYMRWDEAQRYCQNLGANLFIPTAKEGFQVTSYRHIPDPHPPVLDFLMEKLEHLPLRGTHFWIGAVEDDGKRTWTSGEELHWVISLLARNENLSCIRLYVHNERKYEIWATSCKGDTNAPLCQKQSTSLSLSRDQ